MSEAIVTRRTLSVLVENAAGVLSQVSRLFSRKGYNIESLAVGTTDDPAVSRITIEVWADKPMIEQIMNQLRKQFPVYSVQELLPERSIRRELVMFKVRAETPDIRNEIIQIANIFRASIIDVSLKSLTLALIGDETKADAMQKLLEEEEYTRENKARSGIYSAVSTCYWLLVTAVFLFVCFGPYGNAKPQYYWVIWAIAGVLYGAVTAVLKAVRRQ